MVKVHKEKFKKLNLFLFVVLIFSCVISFVCYQKLDSEKRFFQDIDEVSRAYNTATGITKKLVYTHSRNLYITDSHLNPQLAVKIASQVISTNNIHYQTVPFHKKMYFVLVEGGAEGSSDCFIFDEDGKIIIRHLLQDTDPSIFPSQPFMCQVQHLGEDGEVALTLMDNNNHTYEAIYDIYSKQIKNIR